MNMYTLLRSLVTCMIWITMNMYTLLRSLVTCMIWITKVGRFQVRVASPNGDNSVVYLSKKNMDELQLFQGNTVLLKSKKKHTICLVKSDDNIIGIGTKGVIRKNLQVHVGDIVSVQRIHVKHGKAIRVVPIGDTVEGVTWNVEVYLKLYFADAHRPVCVGDRFKIRGFEFKVMATNPSPYCTVAPDTDIHTDGESMREEDEVPLNEVGYDDIGGASKPLAEIKMLVELPLRHPQLFQAMGVKPPKFIVLSGPTGVGKTLIARAVVNETGVYTIWITGPEIMSMITGDAESCMRNAFEEAMKKAPTIIVIDELSIIAPNGDKTQCEIKMIRLLLTLIKNLKQSADIIIIAITDQLSHIDSALLEMGRFINIRIPDAIGRLEILRIYTKNMNVADDVDLQQVANVTHGFVGDDIEAMSRDAKLRQIRKNRHLCYFEDGQIDAEMIESFSVKMDDFMWALGKTHPAGVRERGSGAVG